MNRLLSWCFTDEVTIATEKLLDEAASGALLWVPALWSLEVTNVLLIAERKKRILQEELLTFLKMLRQFKLQVDEGNINRSFHEIFNLARAEQLTSYDASYLELAVRKNLPLASKDKNLRKAATKRGVAIL